MILFHGTDREFDAFSSEHLNSHADRHENGQLGVWVTTDPDLASRFGRFLLAVQTPGDRVFDLSVGDLQKMGNPRPAADVDALVFPKFRQKLLDDGFDIIAIREDDGSAPTRIILNPEGCKIVGRADVTDTDALEAVKILATEENDFAFRGRW